MVDREGAQLGLGERVRAGVWASGKKLLPREFAVDWVYWGAAFLFIGWIDVLFLFRIPTDTTSELRWVFVAALFNSGCFLSALMLLSGAVHAVPWKVVGRVYDGICFLILIGFWLDYLFFRLLSIHLPGALAGCFEGGWRQFWITLEVTGIKPAKLMAMGAALAALPLMGAVLRMGTRRLAASRPVTVQMAHICGLLLLMPTGLTAEAAFASSPTGVNTWLKSCQVMPLSMPFVSFAHGQCYSVRLRPVPPRWELEKTLNSNLPRLERKPDIFIFILESVRPDFLDRETAPNLTRFREENLSFRESISVANATHLAWFSIFHARLPFYYCSFKEDPDRWGGLPLKALRGMGYRVHVLSGGRLYYQQMDELLLGRGRELAESCLIAPQNSQRDQALNESLLKELRAGGRAGGRVFIIGYDSTHHDYDWPSDFPPRFKPYTASWNYLRVTDGDLPGLRNRYRNSIFYVDHLFGEVVSALKELDLYNDSILAVTSDHGEEFREFGHLVHASAINHIQTGAPLIFHFPAAPSAPRLASEPGDVASHIDLMPTLLDYLGAPAEVLDLFDGHSIWRRRHPFALAVAQNFQRDAYQFYLHNGQHKAFYRFGQEKIPIGTVTKIYLTSVTDSKDRPLVPSLSTKEMASLVDREFGPALSCFFDVADLPSAGFR